MVWIWGKQKSPPALGSPSALYLRWVEAHKIEKALLEISLALLRRGRARARSRPGGGSVTTHAPLFPSSSVYTVSLVHGSSWS